MTGAYAYAMTTTTATKNYRKVARTRGRALDIVASLLEREGAPDATLRAYRDEFGTYGVLVFMARP